MQVAQEVAQAEQLSLDDFVLAAIAEKIAAARADPQAFLAVLERIKQAAGPMVEGDKL